MKSITRVIAAACVVLGATSCGTSGVITQARDFEASGNIFLAYHTIESAWEDEDARDAELDEEYWRLRKAYLIAAGKEAVFDEDEAKGIAFFEQVLALDKDNDLALRWKAASKRKLAREAVRRGDDYRFRGDLELSRKAYAEAMTHVPDYAPAEQGLRVVDQYFQERINLAEGFVRDGERKYSDRKFDESFHGGTVAQEYDPASPEAKVLYVNSKKELIAGQVRLAKSAQAAGNYYASLQRFRSAEGEMNRLAEKDPTFVGAKMRAELEEDVRIAQAEVEADGLATKGAIKIARAIDDPRTAENEVDKYLDEAETLLREAYKKSSFQRPRIGDYLAECRERRWSARYRIARDRQLFGQHQESLATFKEIDAEWPDGFRDVKARISSLESDIELAEEAYQSGVKAEGAGKIEEALEHYREAVLFLRNYRGLNRKIAELRKQGKPDGDQN